jgi:hypothetical protein
VVDRRGATAVEVTCREQACNAMIGVAWDAATLNRLGAAMEAWLASPTGPFRFEG